MSTNPPAGDAGRPSYGAGTVAPGAPTVPAQAVPSAASTPRGAAGTVVGGRYTLVSPIGTGGMGTVWRSTDQLLRRDVAVKEVVLPPGMPADEREALTERTLREARAAAALSHPSVVRVFDVVIDGGRPWIVMELLKAHSLAELIERDGPLAPRAVAKIGLAILGALEAAHQAGVLHRDVKPGNVLISADGRCVLSDFGVARSVRDSQMTSPGMVLGSPHFIAPERAIGGRFGPPSDLFSLGVTLYAAAEGKPPFDRGDAISTMHAVVNEPPEPPQRAAELTTVLYGLMEKDPAKRWDAERTRHALRGLLLGPAPQSPAAHTAAATTRMPIAAAPPAGAVQGAQPVSPAARPTSPAGGGPAGPWAAGPHSAGPVSGAPQPTTAMPTNNMPTNGSGAEPWRVGRASVPAGQPAPAAAEPAQQRGFPAYQGPLGYVEAPAPRRSTGAWLFGAAAVLVALALVVAGVGFSSGWFEPDKTPAKPPHKASGPDFATKTYQGRGMAVHVPANWKRRDAGSYVQFYDPKDQTAWLRIMAPWDQRNATRILRSSDQNFTRGCCQLTDYHRVALRPATLAGKRGAELEYTATRVDTGQHRHGIWRMIVVNGRNYQVYMSVPDNHFHGYKKVFTEAARSMKLTG